MSRVEVTRSPQRLTPDPRRVIAKPYLPGEEVIPGGDSRSGLLMQRVLAIPESEVAALLDRVIAAFGSRHRRYLELLEEHQTLVAHHIGRGTEISRERRLLIGAYFTHEYAVEAAALLNPSIVLAPDQSGVAAGQARFVMSLRAVGEGHISSIEFRTGTIEASGELSFDPPGDPAGYRTADCAQPLRQGAVPGQAGRAGRGQRTDPPDPGPPRRALHPPPARARPGLAGGQRAPRRSSPTRPSR